jgi:hypothetical protein
MFDKSRLLSGFQGLVLAATVAAAPASAGPSFSPVGPQRVIVVLVDLGSTLGELCPKPNCPAGIANNVALYQPPRHTAQEWETLLNQYGTQFWNFASYGQAQVQYTVLRNPDRSDGWWKAPHSAQDYWNNGHLFRTQKTYAEVADPAAHAIDVTCAGNPNHPFCVTPTDYTRLLVVSNFKGQGGISDGPFTLITATFGYLLELTMTLNNETASDSMALATITHEFGHQLGIPTHYGNCAAYNDVAVPANYKDPSYPFAPPAPPGFLECTQFWDIMGGHWRWPQPLGYSRWNRGWIASNSTLTYDLFQAAPFSTLTFIRPVELPPANGVPNLIRLSALPLNWPTFGGYFVECRKRIGGEGLYPNSGGVPLEGLLITSVHEWSVNAGVPPVHVIRPTFPAGNMDQAALWLPGQTFTDPKIGLFVRLNGFAGDSADPLCDVEIDYNTPPRTGLILLWQNRVAPGPIQGMGLSGDLGINTPLLPEPVSGAGSGLPLGMAPLWPNHRNALLARAHTTGTLPAQDVKLNLRLTQPARITGSCGAANIGRPNAQILIPSVDPLEGANGSLSFEPRADSLGIQMVAAADLDQGRAESNAVASRFAFLFFRAGRPRTQTTHFIVQSTRWCAEPTSFSIVTPGVPAGWSVAVSPQVLNLNPGETAEVVVAVTPPASARPGAGVEIGVDVLQAEATATPTEATAIDEDGSSVADMEQQTVVGSMQVLARVVGLDARAELSCPAVPLQGHALDLSGRLVPPVQDATVLLEYTKNRGVAADHYREATETRYVTTDSNGVFSDRFLPPGRGMWRVQAFWPGDLAHAPTESNQCRAVFAHRR